MGSDSASGGYTDSNRCPTSRSNTTEQIASIQSECTTGCIVNSRSITPQGRPCRPLFVSAWLLAAGSAEALRLCHLTQRIFIGAPSQTQKRRAFCFFQLMLLFFIHKHMGTWQDENHFLFDCPAYGTSPNRFTDIFWGPGTTLASQEVLVALRIRTVH